MTRRAVNKKYAILEEKIMSDLNKVIETATVESDEELINSLNGS